MKGENGEGKNEATPRGEWYVISDGCDCSNTPGDDAPKSSTRGEVSRSDGGVKEFEVNQSYSEQNSSRAKGR